MLIFINTIRIKKYVICKLISFILETTKDTPFPLVVVLLVGALYGTTCLGCAAQVCAGLGGHGCRRVFGMFRGTGCRSMS
jgi:hypothetical protein